MGRNAKHVLQIGIDARQKPQLWSGYREDFQHSRPLEPADAGGGWIHAEPP